MDFLIIWEWLGVISALIYVYLATKGYRSCFIFGLISSVVFVQICFSEKLYYDTLINSYYIIMSFYGWWSWKNDSGHLRVVSLDWKRFSFHSILILIGCLFVGFLSQTYTQASMPYLDSFTTISAIVATWLMVKKILQNWLIWIMADTVSIYMYYVKEHHPMAILFLVYTVIAVYGYFQWKQKQKVYA